MVVRKAPESSVPAFVAADSESAQAPRTLVIDDDSTGRVVYTLLNGPGARLGDAETVPPASDWAAARSVRGGDGLRARRRRDRGPGRLRHPVRGACQRHVGGAHPDPRWGARAPAAVELRRRGALACLRHHVAGAPRGRGQADARRDRPAGRRRRIRTSTRRCPRAPAIDPRDRRDRRRRLAGRRRSTGPGGEIDLAPVAGPGLLDWSQAFQVPDGTPTVTVRFDSTSRERWLWVQAHRPAGTGGHGPSRAPSRGSGSRISTTIGPGPRTAVPLRDPDSGWPRRSPVHDHRPAEGEA